LTYVDTSVLATEGNHEGCPYVGNNFSSSGITGYADVVILGAAEEGKMRLPTRQLRYALGMRNFTGSGVGADGLMYTRVIG
jgi:hypothetical protein